MFLIAESVTEHSEILAIDPAKLQRDNLDYDGDDFGSLYLRPPNSKVPRWTALFAPAAGTSVDKDIVTATASGLWIIARHGRVFALTFGYGRSLLNMSVVEERFGLIVTLNSIDPETVRSIDRKVVGSLSRQIREQASRGTETRFFGLDVEQDLLRSVTGESTIPELGARLTGKESLSAAVKINLATINGFLQAALVQYAKEDYKASYAWIDNMREVSSPSLRDKLDGMLVDTVQEGASFPNLWIAVPELVDWTRIAGFRFSERDDVELHDDLHLSDFLAAVRNPDSVSLNTLKSRRVYCIDRETEAPSLGWPVFRCISFETIYAGHTYVLNEGKWYQVDPDFVSEVSEAIARIPESSLVFPPFSYESEAEYNEVLSSLDGGRCVLDANNIWHGGGHSQIEFCDVFTDQGILVHVKRYSGSAALSHLFAQGAISAETFLLDREFRKKVAEKVPTEIGFNPTESPIPSEYEIAYAVISKSRKPLALPFFSRVNLRNAARRLSGFGFRVTLSKIQSVEANGE